MPAAGRSNDRLAVLGWGEKLGFGVGDPVSSGS
mgnify:CR=1 FL=1